MHIRMKLLVIAIAALAVLALAGCSSPQSSASPASASSVSAAAASAASSAASVASVASSSASAQAATLDAEGVVTIDLDYSAGTGYEWVSSVEPEGVVTEVDKSTTDESGQKNITGGALQDHFTYRALAPGEVVITFTLERSWEPGEAAETQVYAFTVTDDLNMILNPYKSDFENEPTWGSNS